MKKSGSILLLSLYLFSMIHTMIPVISFHMNHEYIKKHLCRSLTQPEFSDCNGFCFLKKQIDEHKHHDMDAHGPAAYLPKVPFVYLPEIRSESLASPYLQEQEQKFIYHDKLPADVFIDVSYPPPQI